jgi:hypothetical protein
MNPDQLSVPLACWLRADTIVLDGFGNVVAWPDRTTNGRGQVAGIGNATVNPGAYNSKPAVIFDGSTSLAADGGGGIGQPWTLLVFGNIEPNAAWLSTPPAIVDPLEQAFLYRDATPAPTVGMVWQGATTVPVGPPVPGREQFDPYWILVTSDNTVPETSLFIDNGVNDALLQSVLGANADLWPLDIGANDVNPLVGKMLGQIAEVCIWEGLLSPADKLALKTYLGQRYYGLPVPSVGSSRDPMWEYFRAIPG